jgi:RNA polymerase sigma-70 factor (ECF subfamily)
MSGNCVEAYTRPRSCEPSADQDFRATVEKARQGDEGAWTDLVQSYEPQLRRAAQHALAPVLRSEIDPADLVQSVHWSLFVELRRGRYQLDCPEGMLALARVMLRRKVARVWRKLERQKRLVGNGYSQLEWLNGTDAVKGCNSPTDWVLADDEFEHICKILTRSEQRLVELRMLGYTTAEAAREMKRSPDSLRVMLCRLRRKLRQREPQDDRGPSRTGHCTEADAD